MSTLTPSLSALVLLAAAFPTQLVRVATMAGSGMSPATRRRVEQWGLPALAVVVAVLAWVVVAPLPPDDIVSDRPYWIGIAVVVGIVAPLWEIGIGYGRALLMRRSVTRVALHDRAPWPGIGAVLSVSVVALAEETVFRWLGTELLTGPLAWPLWTAVVVTSVVYGLNHLYYGWFTVAQKTVTGAAYAGLYLVAGHAVVVAAVAHLVHNLVVLLVVPRWGGRA